MRLINPNTKDSFVAPRCGASGQTLLQEKQVEVLERRGAQEHSAGFSAEPGTLGLHSTRKGRSLGNSQHIPAREATPGFPACGAEPCLACSPR